MDEYIDRLEHSNKQQPPLPAGGDPLPTQVKSPFEEFVAEKQGTGNFDPKAQALYESALDILSKKRWSSVAQRDLRSAYMDLEEAAQMKHTDAEKLLAFSLLFGDYRWSIDEARGIFERLAAGGSADAHLGLAFLHSTGIGLGEPNPARGLLHYTFAAAGGSPLAQMALGYRHGYGVSTAQNCEASLGWYQQVAERVASAVKITGTSSIQRIRIPEEIESSSSTSTTTLLDSNVFSYYKVGKSSGTH